MEREEYDRYVTKHRRELLNYAMRLEGAQREAAEDLVQETLINAWRGIHTYKPAYPMLMWLRSVMKHRHIDRLRMLNHPGTVSLDTLTCPELGDELNIASLLTAGDTDDPCRILMDKQISEPLLLALSSVNPLFREAFLLTHIDGLTYEEAAVRAGISVGTMRSRIHRARLAMYRQMTGKTCLPANSC